MKTKQFEEARELRKNGESISSIAKKLSVSKGSVSVWCSDIQLTDEQRVKLEMKNPVFRGKNNGAMKNKEKALELRKKYQEQGKEIAKKYDKDIDFAIGCALYWAEGNKDRKVFGVSNLDISLLLRIKKWAIKYFGCENEKFKIQINAYLNNGVTINDMINYWTDNLSIPVVNVGKIIARERYYSGKNRKKKQIYGICQLRYCDVEIVQKIFGAIQEIMKIKMEEWVL